MSITLAATWNPRGELDRFRRLLPWLEELYAAIVICFPPVAGPHIAAEVEALGFLPVEVEAAEAGDGAGRPALTFPTAAQAGRRWSVASPVWAWGRYLALKAALETPGDSIQYADMDRLLRWAETRPDELRGAAGVIEQCDCLVIGRTQAAYETHPQALVRTEAISNLVVSHLLDRQMDVSAGSKGFSRRAAQFVIENSLPERALGTDAEWPVLAHRAGLAVDYMAVDGLDWESADRYQLQAASAEAQKRAARAYDLHPGNWASRVEVAMEIVQSGLDACQRPVAAFQEPGPPSKEIEDLPGKSG